MNGKNLFYILMYSTTIIGSMTDQYFSLSSSLNYLSGLTAKQAATQRAGIKPIEINLKNIHLQSPDAQNKDAFASGLEIFSRTPDARKDASTIAKIKADAIELLKIDKNFIDQVEKILKNIGFTPEQINKETALFKKIQPKPVQAPSGTVKISIKMFPHIKNQLDILKAMDVKTPEKKEAQRDRANEYMNVLEEYVLKNKGALINNKNKIQEIEATCKAILSITPLTISTVIKTLRNAGFDQSYIYKLITDTYEKQIKFIESEAGLGSRNISQKGERPNKGPCDDISDALSYGIAISSEVIPLKTKLDVESGLSKIEDDFLKKITALQAGLDAFLNSSDNIKQAFYHCTQLTVDAYSKMIEIRRPIYCRRNELEHEKLQSGECTSYISFYGLLESIGDLIAQYAKANITKIQKANIQQKIINQLNNFIYYNTPSAKVQICQQCLGRDIFRWIRGEQHPEDFWGTPGGLPPKPEAHKDYANDLTIQFKKITDFFEKLPLKEKNASTESGIISAHHIHEMLNKALKREIEY